MKKILLNALVAVSLCCGQAMALKTMWPSGQTTSMATSVAESDTTNTGETQTQAPDTLIITVTTPGAMGDSILAQVENLSDVKCLRLSGTLNDDDLSTLKSRLTGLTYLDMSDVKMTALPDKFFYQKSNLTQVVLPKTLTSIGEQAFYECTGLTEMDFPTSLKSIGYYAFYKCTKLQQVVLPEGLTSLGTYAFQYCSANEYVKLPSTLATISDYAFEYNYNLKTVDFSEGNKYIGTLTFYQCKALESLKFPSTLYSVGTQAFRSNYKLSNIEFNEGLYSISDDAFRDCDSLKEVAFPSSLVLAYGGPFYGCDSLKKVTCLSIEPPFTHNAQIPEGCSMTGRVLYVPALSINSYKQTTGWDQFPTIKAIDYLPENFTVVGDLHLTLPETIPSDYKPCVSLIHDQKGSSYYYYGSLTVNGEGTLSMQKFSTIWDPNWDYSYASSRDKNYCSLINNSHLRADSVEVSMYARNDKWTFFSLPFNTNVSDIETTEGGTTNYVIYKYDGQARANGETGSTWVKMPADSTLQAGVGYILQGSRYVGTSSQDYSGYLMKAINDTHKNDIFTTTDINVALNEYQSEYAHNRSWNLIGNPYPCYYDSRFMDFIAPITVWSTKNSTYTAYSPVDDSYILHPGEAFFVQRPVDMSSITFSKEGRQATSTARTIETCEAKAMRVHSASARTLINLTLSDGENADKTRVVLNAAAEMDYEMDKDASKFMSTNANVPQIYTTQNGVDYAINERPLESGTVDVAVCIPADGTYTIALANEVADYTIMLEDKLLGKTVSLSESGAYEFSATTDDAANRFVLHISNGSTTGINTLNSDSNDEQSTYYTIGGQRISKPMQKGVYIKNNKKVLIK